MHVKFIMVIIMVHSFIIDQYSSNIQYVSKSYFLSGGHAICHGRVKHLCATIKNSEQSADV